MISFLHPWKKFSPTSDNNINKIGNKWLSRLEPEFISQIHMAIPYSYTLLYDMNMNRFEYIDFNKALIVTKNKMVYFVVFEFDFDKNVNRKTYKNYNIRKFDFLCEKGVKSFIGCRHDHFLVLTETGEVYFCNDRADIHSYHYKNELKEEMLPILLKINWNEKIVDIAYSFDNFLALTIDGKVYAGIHFIYGQMKDYYREMKDENKYHQKIADILADKKIVSISCNYYSYMIVTSTGELWSWNTKRWREKWYTYLPVDFSVTSIWLYSEIPIQITALAHVRIVKVACGNNHTLVLTDEGNVYSFGYSHDGQLGIARLKNRNTYIVVPEQVEASVMGQVTDIAAAGSMSAAVGKGGRIFVWGSCKREVFTPMRCPMMNLQEALTFYSSEFIVHIPLTPHEKAEKHMVDCLRKAFDDPSTSDFRMDVRGRPIYLHKTILKIRSKYFRTMLQRDENVIRCDRFCYDIYKAFFMFLYTGECFDLSSKDIFDLLQLAELANIHDEKLLLRHCVATIKRKITVSNVVNVYVAIKSYKTRALQDMADFCLQFTTSNMSAVEKTDDFAKLDWQLLKNFTSFDNDREHEY